MSKRLNLYKCCEIEVLHEGNHNYQERAESIIIYLNNNSNQSIFIIRRFIKEKPKATNLA